MNYLNELIANGYEIYPVKNKVPLTKHGYKDATSDVATIKQWKHEHVGCQWSLRLDTSDLMVLDVDNHDDQLKGSRALNELANEQQEFLGNCPVNITPNNGIHIFMRKPKNTLVNDINLGNGLEIKTKNICLYDEFTRSVLEAPEAKSFILNMAKPKQDERLNFLNNDSIYKPIRSYWVKKLSELMEGTTTGNRDSWLTHICGTWLNSGLSVEEVFKLLQFANMNCDDPLKEKQVRKVLYSLCKKEGLNDKRVG